MHVFPRIVMPILMLMGVMGQAKAANATSVLRRATWKAPSDPIKRTIRAGLVPERFETLKFHVHAHLDVFVDGHTVVVPAGIGINIHDPGVHHGQTPQGPAYGGIKMCARPCISPLHTHDASGILHTEAATAKPNSLGEFFVEWGVRLNRSCVNTYCRPHTRIAVFINGKRLSGSPAAIALTDHKEIAIVIGTPPKHIPAIYDFSNA